MKVSFSGTLDEFLTVFGPAVLTYEEVEGTDLAVEPSLSLVPSAEDQCIAPKSIANENKVVAEGLSEERKEKAISNFAALCRAWVVGFGVEGTEQPDRIAMLRDFAAKPGLRDVLLLTYEWGSLQRLVSHCLDREGRTNDEWITWIEQVATNMVAISHMALPDLAGTLDYSEKWKKDILVEE